MKVRLRKLLPVILGTGAIAFVCLLHYLSQPDVIASFSGPRRLEAITYDWRVKRSFDQTAPSANNLAALFIDDIGLSNVNASYQFSWPWPRQLHGKIVNELNARGAKAIGFDILFAELHPVFSSTSVKEPNGTMVPSDEYFTRQLKAAGNVAIAAMSETVFDKRQMILPADLFRTNAQVAHILSTKDTDGIMRRAIPYVDDPRQGRLWNLGIVLAARGLDLDLNKTEIKPHEIVLHGQGNVSRTIPLLRDGTFYINWELEWNDRRILKASYDEILASNEERRLGTNDMPRDFEGKIVIVGSVGSGNNISDLGPTSLSKETYLVSKHWNVANSIIMSRFVHITSLAQDFLLIIVLGVLAAACTMALKPLLAGLGVFAVGVGYLYASFFLYTEYRWSLPVVMPVGGGLFFTHFTLLTYRLVFATKEQRRVKGIFSKIVSPNVVHELLKAETLSLGGTIRRVTVFFADVRGFTELTDVAQQRAEDYVRTHNLTGKEASDYLDKNSQDLLATVNLYLSTIANVIKQHDGTLDKYIGDCVMAFWGAPTPNEKHAATCVYTAIDAQRAIYELNQRRAEENARIAVENERRAAAGEPTLTPLALLALGSGINTGLCTVGLMGSDAHILSYTVFGREVNLASRLEGVSGRSRIIIGEATYLDLKRDDPTLAAQCIPQPALQVKGFRNAVQVYEVPWKPAGSTALEQK